MKKFLTLLLLHKFRVVAGIQESKKLLRGGSDVFPNSKVIEKSPKNSKKYMGARRSCAWIHIHPNSGSSKNYSPARPSRVNVLKT